MAANISLENEKKKQKNEGELSKLDLI